MGDAQSTSHTTHAGIATDALAHVHAASAADAVLSRIAAGTAHPDELGDSLLRLIETSEASIQTATVRGFMRAIAKHLELVSSQARRAR